MENQFNASPEVVEPEIVTPEVVIPETAEVEVAEQVSDTPEKIEQTPEENSKFKELRLKHEKELADERAKFEAKMAELQKQIEEVNPIKEKYEAEQKQNALKQFAEANGLTYEEALAIAEEEEEKETLRTQLTEKEQREKELQEKLDEIQRELDFQKLITADKEALRSIDPSLDINNLGESFFKFRLNGMTVEEALSAVRAKESLIEKAPVLGKLGDDKPTSEFISESEWDSMSSDQQQHLLKTDLPRVLKSQSKWLDT